MKGRYRGVLRLLRRAWIPLLLVVVVAIGGYAIVRIKEGLNPPAASNADGNADNTAPFNPKKITYEITGGAGGTATIDYLDENGQPHHVETALPWSYSIVTTLPSMSANIVAQASPATDGLRCRVVVDGQVRDDRSTDEYQPFIYCLVKSV